MSTSTSSAPSSARYRDAGHPEQAHGRPGDPAAAQLHPAGGAREREIAMSSGQLRHGEPAAGTPDRQVQGGHQLVGLERGQEGRHEELAGRDAPGAPGAARLDGGVERERDRGQLRGGVGVSQRPAERAAVADLEMPDVRRGPGQQRRGARDHLIPLQRAMPGQGAHPQRAVRPGDALQPGDAVDIDDVLRPAQPHGHHRHQALPAREHLCLVAQLGQHPHRLVNRRRPVVIERRSLHIRSLSSHTILMSVD
jgi:hypothetical protein